MGPEELMNSYRNPKPGWISVKDQLPELSNMTDFGLVSDAVLCKHKDGHHEDCILNEPDEPGPPYWTFVQDGDYTESVTHWMLIPL